MGSPLPTETLPSYSHQQILRVITGIMLCILLAALDQTVVIPAVPAIAADLNAFGHLSWLVSAYLLTSTAATPIYGKLSDIYGRRTLLLPALALFIVASVLCALAQTLPQLIAARALQGLGGAGLMSMAQAAVADVVAPRERGRYQGYMASMWGVASIAGPIVGGYMTEHLSWRFVFWINLPLGLAAMALCNRALRVLVVRRQSARIDYLGAALLASFITAWLLVLSWGGTEFAWTSPQILGLVLAGALLFATLVWHERRAPDPILPPRLFAHAVFLRGVVIAFFASLGLFGATFLLPLYFQLIGGADAGRSGLLVVPFLGSSVLGAFTGGQMARKLGRTKAIVITGLLCCSAGFVLMATLAPGMPPALAIPYMVLLGAGLGATMPSVLMQVQNAAERRDVGAATGSLLFLRSMGGAVGSTVVGALLVGRFNSGLYESGVASSIDLGGLRKGSDALAALSPAAKTQAIDALLAGFHIAFGTCAGLLLIAIAVAAGMGDVKLRSAAVASPGLGH